MQRAIVTAKILVIVSSIAMIGTTYVLRSHLLTILQSFVSAQDVIATDDLDRFLAVSELRELARKADLAAFEGLHKRYLEQLRLYSEDVDAYMRQTDYGRARPPQRPRLPRPPRSPEVQEQLVSLNQSFRADRATFFSRLNLLGVIVAICGITLVASLLFLTLFDPTRRPFVYIILLAMTFLFLIGPAFHAILTTVAANMRPPAYLEREVLWHY